MYSPRFPMPFRHAPPAVARYSPETVQYPRKNIGPPMNADERG